MRKRARSIVSSPSVLTHVAQNFEQVSVCIICGCQGLLSECNWFISTRSDCDHYLAQSRNSECSDKTTDLLPHISRSDNRERAAKNHTLLESAGFNLYIVQVLDTPDGHICTLGLYITVATIKASSNSYFAMWFPTWLLRSTECSQDHFVRLQLTDNSLLQVK